MSALYLVLIRLVRFNGPEIPLLWMFAFLFGLDCWLAWFCWPL